MIGGLVFGLVVMSLALLGWMLLVAQQPGPAAARSGTGRGRSIEEISVRLRAIEPSAVARSLGLASRRWSSRAAREIRSFGRATWRWTLMAGRWTLMAGRWSQMAGRWMVAAFVSYRAHRLAVREARARMALPERVRFDRSLVQTVPAGSISEPLPDLEPRWSRLVAAIELALLIAVTGGAVAGALLGAAAVLAKAFTHFHSG
ncbi:MAG TPA: hypothetical protein VGA30_07295 [Actinomycetota bacterium]